jgi:lysophospholipase L1-like esterase
MKTILCLGDSDAWGYVPESAERYAYEDRWTSILQKGIGEYLAKEIPKLEF